MISRFLFFTLVALSSFQLRASMTIQIVNAPQLTPLLDTLYLAGTINDWNAASETHMFSNNNGIWVIVINGVQGSMIQFKITRGGWSRVEGSINGGYIPNRSLTYQENGQIQITIAGWEDIPGTTTVTPHVRILDSNFYIPQLNRYRRIWVALPSDYSISTNYYPVMYMHDGQNLFNAGTSFSGEWSIDESLIDPVFGTCSESIIIGIDNGGAERLNEYAPWINQQYNAGGQGDEYAAFIVETLKPFIDGYFRTLPDRGNTAIGGSSLGALISAYTIFSYPEFFSKAALFSSAYWFNPEIFDLAASAPVFPDTKFYHVCGTSEGSGSVLEDQQEMNASLSQAGYANENLFQLDWTDGEHSEWFWEREFPAAFDWLFQCFSTTEENQALHWKLYPNPASDTIQLENLNGLSASKILVINSIGQFVIQQDIRLMTQFSLNISSLPIGTYKMLVLDEQRNFHSMTFQKN